MIPYTFVRPGEFLEQSHPNTKEYPGCSWPDRFESAWRDRKGRNVSYLVHAILAEPDGAPTRIVRVWDDTGECRSGHLFVAAYVALDRDIPVHYCRTPVCNARDDCADYVPKPIRRRPTQDQYEAALNRRIVMTAEELNQCVAAFREEIESGHVPKPNERNY